MTSILLIGGGGHCRSCIDVIESGSNYQIAGIVQPTIEDVSPVMGYPILGTDADLSELLKKTENTLITIGQIKSYASRQRLYVSLKNLGAKLPVISSPNAYCSRHSWIDEGTIVMHGSTVNAHARIGANCIINSHALVEHDVEIAEHCHVSTGARINGGVRIGKGCFIGSGSILKEYITIGEDVVIGAGQIVMKDVPSGSILTGNHAQ
jgi:sugar O-acyltransferase (sialic acid O-acetyltransferase NeuD family)